MEARRPILDTTWYWVGAAGRGMRFGEVTRRYEFDANECRLLHRWWLVDTEHEEVTQSLRCYAPADLRLLLEGTDLVLASLVPGEAMDWNGGQFVERVPLARAMQYRATLVTAPWLRQPECRRVTTTCNC